MGKHGKYRPLVALRARWLVKVRRLRVLRRLALESVAAPTFELARRARRAAASQAVAARYLRRAAWPPLATRQALAASLAKPALRAAGLLVWAAALVLGLATAPATAQENCRQALAIGLDISGSVDRKEYRLQMDGLAGALLNPDVVAAFLAMPAAPVRLFVFEWGGTGSQRMLVPWIAVTDTAVLQRIAETLRATPRRPREVATALGQAMLFGGGELAAQSDCWRLTLDMSGDGQSNIGPRPRDVRGRLLAGLTINAIVIGAEAGDYQVISDSELVRLRAYFRAEVIRGPEAFVESATGFEDFERAMARKLLKELQTLAIGLLAPPAPESVP